MAHNGGQLQVNLGFPDPYYECWALNFCKMQLGPFLAVDASDTDWPALISGNRYPTAMPTGGGAYWQSSQLWIYGDVGDTIDLVYPSQHTLSLHPASDITLTETVSTDGHKRYTIGGTPPWSTAPDGSAYCSALVGLRITAMSGNDWTGGISVYRTEHQALIDAGEIFNPLFLARLGYGDVPFGTIRFMDWGQTNLNTMKVWAHRNTVDSYTWADGSGYNVNRFATGTTTKSRNDYVTGSRLPGNPVSWTDGQVVQFYNTAAPTFKAVTITKGNPTSFNCTGHGYSNDDKIFIARDFIEGADWSAAFWGKSTSTGLTPDFVVTRTDDDNFTIPLDSSGFGDEPTGQSVAWNITLSDGTLPAKRCYRAGFESHFTTEWGGVVNAVVTGVYHEEFDAIIYGGDNSQNVLNVGLPVEIMCELANKLQANPWFTIPWGLEGAGERSYIQCVKDNLDAGLTPIFQKLNEPWNTGFFAWNFCRAHSCKEFGINDSMNGYGDRHNDMADNVATVFANDREYLIAMDAQNVSNYAANVGSFKCGPLSGYVDTGTPGNAALYPLNKSDIVSTAPYCTVNFQYHADANTYPGFIDDCLLEWLAGNTDAAYQWFADELSSGSSDLLGTQEPLDTHITTHVKNWVDGLSGFTGRKGTGIQYRCYEGGVHVVGSTALIGGFPSGGVTVQNVHDFYIGYLQSRQHAHFVQKMCWQLKGVGVTEPSQYTLSGPWQTGFTWGAGRLNDMDAADTRQLIAFKKFNKGIRTFALTAT